MSNFFSKFRKSNKVQDLGEAQEMKNLELIIERELLSTPPSQEFLDHS